MGLETKQINQKVRYLKVDISIDEQSEHYQPKYDSQSTTLKTHSGIDTIYHI